MEKEVKKATRGCTVPAVVFVTIVFVVFIIFGVLVITGKIGKEDHSGCMLYNSDHIPIYADGVVDFCQSVECDGENDSCYYIEYAGNLYGEFYPREIPEIHHGDPKNVKVYCSKEVFKEYREWYDSFKNQHGEFHSTKIQFYIVAKENDNMGTRNLYYVLVKNEEE